MIVESWTPVVIKHHGKTFEKEVFEKYEVSDICNIRNAKTKQLFSTKRDGIGLSGNGTRIHLLRYRICLASFFPDEIPHNINDYDVDHIDGNHSNNALSNLQWLSKSDHSKKTRKQEKRDYKISSRGKPVKVIKVKGDGNKNHSGRIFFTVHDAARKLNLGIGSISKSAHKGNWVQGMYKFEFVLEPYLEGEVFKPIGEYEISNRGRLKNKFGEISRGSKMTLSKYRCTQIKLECDVKSRQYLIHVLVWIAFNGPIPKGKVVMHNDSYNTLDDEGYERNWLEDLSLGTQSENIQSYHDNRQDLKRVRCVDSGEEFNCAAEAGRKMKVHRSSISSACQGKYNTAGGYRWEYVNN